MILISILLATSWSDTFHFNAPVADSDGVPRIEGTVNVYEPGLPQYPVRTVFIPVPPGSEPVLQFAAPRTDAFSGTIPRAAALTGSGLEVMEVPAEPVNRRMEAAELQGVIPLAGATVAVVNIHPLTERGFSSSIDVSLTWEGDSRGVPVPDDHLLSGLVEGDVFWPDPVHRAESPFHGKPWARISISDTGGYRVSCQELENAGCDVSGVPVSTLAMFSGPGVMFANAPETEHNLEEVAILVEDDGDGIFNGGDEIIFLAGGLNRYEMIEGRLQWLYHRYDAQRVYWLTWGGAEGARMATVSGTPDGSPGWGSTLPCLVHLEESGVWFPWMENRTGWFMERLDDGESLSIPVQIGSSAGSAAVTLFFAVTEEALYTVSLQGCGSVQLSGEGRASAVFNDVNLGSTDKLTVTFDSHDPESDLYFDYVELEFPVPLTASGRRLFPQREGRYSFRFTGADMVFDTSDLMQPVRITGIQDSRFSHTLTPETSLLVLGSGDWRAPVSIEPASPGRLVGTITAGDRLLVVPPEFTDDALALRALLEQMGYSVVTATTSEIYDEFGQGVKDPGAIRSAVRWGMDSWTTPLSTVILCGDGNYDPLGHATTIPDLIPPKLYLTNNEKYPVWASEDWMSQVHPDATYPEIPVARIPAGNVAEFGAVCAKSSFYHTGEAGGSWSSRIVLFADDEWNYSSQSERMHTLNSEAICYNSLPEHASPEKFYLIEFPWPPGTVPGGVHPEKPEARTAFLELWNQGMGIMLFQGHGSANLLTEEKVMLGEDPAALENGARLPLAMFMSCDISRFFNPGVECIGEKVVYHPGGGAIASIGASGPSSSGSNRAYAESILNLVYTEKSMGYAFWAGKLRASRSGNSERYVFLGIPDLHLMAALPEVEITLQGDTLRSGEVNTVSGAASSSDGLALIEIRESDIPWQYTMLGSGVIDYYRQGGTAWRGREPFAEGQFTADCIIPAASAPGALARADGAGVVSSGVQVGSAAPLVLVEGDPAQDFQGPEMDMWISGQRDVEEPVITGDGSLEAELSDSSGISFLGRSGSSIQLFVDDTEFDLSDSFSYNTGSTVTGQLQYTVSGLANGEHRFILRAADGVGNISSDTLYVTSTDEDEVSIQQHLVYPNPGSGTRSFSFSVSTAAHVEVSIFTTAGRRIRTLSKMCSQGYNQIIWDGLDADGDTPASGSYIYLIEAQTESGLFSKSSSVTGVLATVN